MSSGSSKPPKKLINQEKLRWYVPKRYIVTLLGFLGFVSVYTMRVNLSVAMVSMVNTTVTKPRNESFLSGECPTLKRVEDKFSSNDSSIRDAENNYKQYNWDTKTQGHIMSAFFYGYFLTMICGGYFAETFGAKKTFGGGLLLTSVLTLLTPVAVEWGIVPFLILRALEGIGEGFSFPAINVLISRWAPKSERSRISSAIFVGIAVGNVVSLTVSGWLCRTSVFGGWPTVFYVFGTAGVVLVVLWSIFIFESPDVHPWISHQELHLICDSVDFQMTDKRPDFPWKKIATSSPAWALLATQTGAYLGSILILTEFPTYLNRVLNVDVETSGLVTGLPNILECLGGFIASFAADAIIVSKKISRTHVRKIFNTIAMYSSCLCVLGFALSKCHYTSLILLLCTYMFMNSFKYSGFNVTHVDMCAPLAGSLYGLINGVACLTGIIGPNMVSAFTANGDTIENWSYVFYVVAAIYFVSGTIYTIFGSSDPQPWLDDIAIKNNKKEKENISCA